MWLMKARCCFPHTKGEFQRCFARESDWSVVGEIYGSLLWSTPGGFVPKDSFLFFCSKTCFYDFTKKTRQNRSLQLYILQPAWTLRRSRGARCKYFPLLRSYRKEPSNHQLQPRTIRMLPHFVFKTLFFTRLKRKTSFSLGSHEAGLPAGATEEASQPLSLCSLGFNRIS